jgi:hypothetical protein
MAAPAPALAGGRPQILLVLAVVLLIRVPFLNQAVQGDDIYYLAGAQHAQIDPLHPNHARYGFLGEMVDMRGHPHPPLNCWFLAVLLAIFGDVYEVPFHTAYMLWSLMAALAAWSLAKRFTPQPLPATLLFLATPAFVVNGNSFESDLPFLALWMAALALFIKAAEARVMPQSRGPWDKLQLVSGGIRKASGQAESLSHPGAQAIAPETEALHARSGKWLAGAALSLALAALAAYQAVLIVPVLWAYLWLRARRWRAGWLVTLVPVATLAGWQLFERASTGALPASVLAGYFHAYGFQDLGRKLANAAALTAHAGWLVFPLLAVVACRGIPRWSWAVVLLGTAGAALLDSNPLFWASFGTGLLLICYCAASLRDASFLSAWVLIFFAGALILFFAGSARYLLPIAAAVALLVSRNLSQRPRWLIAGAALQLLLGLCLSTVNYQHWEGYRRFARSLVGESAQKRVWINGEWGLRYYLETEGGLALMRGQAVRPGDMVVSSRLAMPIEFTTGGGALVPVAQWEIRSWLPFRLTALGARSAYSTIALGLRPFDVGSGPIDVVRAEAVVERRPTLEYLPMNAPEAEQQIVSGVYALESNQWRWMGDRALMLLKRPERPLPLQAVFYIPDNAAARRISMTVDGQPVAERAYAGAGMHTLASAPIAGAGDSVTVTITVDQTFSVAGDHRRLGIILSAVGFKAAR